MMNHEHLPQGARALIVALATPAPRGHVGIPVLLWGRPGVGKSSFIEGMANDELTVTTLIASIHDPTDFSGLPVMSEGKVKYAVPEWVDGLSKTENSILFLDELSTAPPSVQSALLRVVFERSVGFQPLPQGVRIVAAANPPDLMVGGWDLSPPLRNRFVHLQWSVSTQLYLRSLNAGWATVGLPMLDLERFNRALTGWQTTIAGFLRVQPAALHADPELNRYGFASPRSWDYATALLCASEQLGYTVRDEEAGGRVVVLELLTGCLGEATAISLLEYLVNLRLPDPARVLAGKATVTIADLDDAELFTLFYGLNDYLQRELADRGPQLLAYSQRYLLLAEAAFATGRRDVIFAPLRQLAREGWLVAVLPAADPELRDTVLRIFGDAAFAEFADVLA